MIPPTYESTLTLHELQKWAKKHFEELTFLGSLARLPIGDLTGDDALYLAFAHEGFLVGGGK